MWGMIAWQKTPKNDENNPNPAMHSKPLVGTAILIGMKPAGDRYEGDIYNPRNGKVYSSKMALLPSGKLADQRLRDGRPDLRRRGLGAAAGGPGGCTRRSPAPNAHSPVSR